MKHFATDGFRPNTASALSRRRFLQASAVASLLGVAGHGEAALGEGSSAAGSRVASKIVAIAHRGAHLDCPENTLAAFRKAIALRCDFVEMDVRATKDGALVIMHDSTVNRTTNGSGKVADMALAEIRSLAIKNLQSSGLSAETVPTFDEAMAVCRGRIKIYIDHKSGSPADVLAAIEKRRMLDQVVFYAPVDRLRIFKRLSPGVRVVCEPPAKREEFAAMAAELKPLCLAGHHLKWSRDDVAAAHRAGAEVWADVLGPFDGPVGYLWAAKTGVDAIQSDHPDLLTAWRDGGEKRGGPVSKDVASPHTVHEHCGL